jgi:triacylglycerol lipase
VTHHVVLIPGFFGFVNLGDLTYFKHVRAHINSWAQAHRIDVVIHRPPTPPTASLAVRARVLYDLIQDEVPADDGPIHLIGHSAGGLDARWLTSPVTVLEGVDDLPSVAERVTSVVCVSTPHRGTPLATLFDTVMGGPLLRLLSIISTLTLRGGEIPLSLATRLIRAFKSEGVSEIGNVDDTLYDNVDDSLREGLKAFVRDISVDQRLVGELSTGRSIERDLRLRDRDGIRYASVATVGQRPGLRTTVRQGVRPDHHASHAVYTTAWSVGATSELVPPLGAVDHSGVDIESVDNDGIVPTASQLRGHVIATLRGDHLDVLGHYTDRDANPRRYDWLRSGSQCNDDTFSETWNRICTFVFHSE